MKVVVCDRGINAHVEEGVVVRDAGGIGMILANTEVCGEESVADRHLLPAVARGRKAGDMNRKYVKSHLNATAVLSFGGTVLSVRPSPMVAAYVVDNTNSPLRDAGSVKVALLGRQDL